MLKVKVTWGFMCLFVCMILFEPVGLDSRNVAQPWPLIPCRSLLNMQTLRQRSHTLGPKMWCLSLIQHSVTSEQYLALSKGWNLFCVLSPKYSIA